MTNFTVRVELHDAKDSHYEELHDAMAEKGFVRWIKGADIVKRQLPTAEYNMLESELTKKQVLERAKAAADQVKPNPTPWILVTESGGRKWSGLKAW